MKQQDQGIHSKSQEFAGYDQVDKPLDYHLAEQEDELFDEEYRVKSCDIGRFLHGDAADRRRFSQELGEALEEIGFAILEGHGGNPQTLADALACSQGLFTENSLEAKMRFAAQRQGSVNQGYFAMKQSSEIHPDLVEGWVYCRRAFDLPDNRGPAGTESFEEFWLDPGHEPIFRRLVRANERLIKPIMQSILIYLGCEPNLYDAKLTRTNVGLRLNYYPPMQGDDIASGAGRLLGHEDVGMFTLLPAPETEGLQAFNHKTMKWVRLAAPSGSIILNTGDYMQRITNDIMPSTTHRVSPPRDTQLRSAPRLTIPMNVYVWEDEILDVLPGLTAAKYEPIRAVEFHTRTTSKFYGEGYAADS